MAEKARARIYLLYLDRILAGEKNIEPVDDAEIKELLLLSRTMTAADFSINSKIRETFREQLLGHAVLKSKSGLTLLSGYNDELNEEALEHVAAGFAEPYEDQKTILKHMKLPGK